MQTANSSLKRLYIFRLTYIYITPPFPHFFFASSPLTKTINIMLVYNKAVKFSKFKWTGLSAPPLN
jgi:hypothetical protein